jgi:hypothetical protein
MSETGSELHPEPDPMEEEAVNAEVQALVTSFENEIRESNRNIEEAHLKILVDLKCKKAKDKIPFRWHFEEIFKKEARLTRKLRDRLRGFIDSLAEGEDDHEAEVLARQAKNTIAEWDSNRRHQFEKAFEDASRSWYKVEEDPLEEVFMANIGEFDSLDAKLMSEIQKRPLLRKALEPGHKADNTSSVVVSHEKKPFIHFDVSKLFPKKFAGDPNDEELLIKFANWRSTWDNLIPVMKEYPGFNDLLLFGKLKDTLEDPALSMVSRYSSNSNNSYEAAYKDLVEKFNDPIGLAGSYINKAKSGHKDDFEMADAIHNSFDALHEMQDVFQEQNVNMWDFSLMNSFTSAMSSTMLADWQHHKAEKKECYKVKVASAKDKGEPIPEWNSGMVENHKEFCAWLKLFSAKKPRASESLGASPPVTTADNFALNKASVDQDSGSKDCFLCQTNDHPTTRCKKGQAMSLKEWQRACRLAKRCFKCAKEYTPGHSCRMKCKVCRGKSYDNDHHVLMCPLNPYRKEKPEKAGSSSSDPSGRKRKAEGLTLDDESLKKISKIVQAEMKKGESKAKPKKKVPKPDKQEATKA